MNAKDMQRLLDLKDAQLAECTRLMGEAEELLDTLYWQTYDYDRKLANKALTLALKLSEAMVGKP